MNDKILPPNWFLFGRVSFRPLHTFMSSEVSSLVKRKKGRIVVLSMVTCQRGLRHFLIFGFLAQDVYLKAKCLVIQMTNRKQKKKFAHGEKERKIGCRKGGER